MSTRAMPVAVEWRCHCAAALGLFFLVTPSGLACCDGSSLVRGSRPAAAAQTAPPPTYCPPTIHPPPHTQTCTMHSEAHVHRQTGEHTAGTKMMSLDSSAYQSKAIAVHAQTAARLVPPRRHAAGHTDCGGDAHVSRARCGTLPCVVLCCAVPRLTCFSACAVHAVPCPARHTAAGHAQGRGRPPGGCCACCGRCAPCP